MDVGPSWEPRTQAHWPIALSLILIYKELFSISVTLPRATIPLSLVFLFAPDPSWQRPRSAPSSFPTTGIHIKCVPAFFFFNLHLLYEGVFGLPILCNIYCSRLIWPFRSSTSMNWTYLSVGTSWSGWLVIYLPPTLCSACFLFTLNLLKDTCRKIFEPIRLVLITSLATLSAILFRDILKITSNFPKNYVKFTHKLHKVLIRIMWN